MRRDGDRFRIWGSSSRTHSLKQVKCITSTVTSSTCHVADDRPSAEHTGNMVRPGETTYRRMEMRRSGHERRTQHSSVTRLSYPAPPIRQTSAARR